MVEESEVPTENPQEHAGTERWWIQTQDLLDLKSVLPTMIIIKT